VPAQTERGGHGRDGDRRRDRLPLADGQRLGFAVGPADERLGHQPVARHGGQRAAHPAVAEAGGRETLDHAPARERKALETPFETKRVDLDQVDPPPAARLAEVAG